MTDKLKAEIDRKADIQSILTQIVDVLDVMGENEAAIVAMLTSQRILIGNLRERIERLENRTSFVGLI